MIVTMVSRVMSVLSQLSEEIQEYQAFLNEDLKAVSDGPLEMMKSYTPLARFIMILKHINIPNLCLDLFFQTHKKVLILKPH